MKAAAAALLTVLLAGAQPPQPGTNISQDDAAVAVRELVQQYYAAQAQRDPDKTLSFWSASANPRPTREAFLAVFGEPAEDSFVVDVRSIEVKGIDARVRVAASRTRLIMRNGVPSTQRSTFLNSQIWRREAAGWKLLRDGPFAEEIADDLIAAQPSDRPALFEKNRADLVQARLAISQRATMAVTLGRNYARGKTLFELALDVSRAAGDRHGEANSLHNIAQAAYFLGDYATATDFYQKELAVAREIDEQDMAAAALFGLATVAYSRAEYTPALGLYRDALAVYEKQDDGAAIGRAVVSIGNVQYLQAEYDAATASYRRALGVLVAAHDPQGASFAKSGLARVFVAQGDLAAALDMYGQVLADARGALKLDPRGKSNVAAPLESIGQIYYRLGNPDQARANFEEARKLSEDDPSSVARISASLGVTELVAGRFEAALAAYTESRAKYELAKQPDGVARAWVGIGFSHAAREKFVDAIAAYRTAIRMFEDQRLAEDSGRAWLGLSLAQSGTKDDEAALASAQKVRVIADAVKSEDLAWRAAARTGEALYRLRRLDESRDEFRRAIAAIDRLAADAPTNPDARAQLDDSASAWSGLALTLAAAGDARGALDAAEARRANARRVQLSAFQRDITRGMTPEEEADEQSIVREMISTRAQLRAERDARHADAARLDRLQQQLTGLVTRRAEQQAKLYARLPELQRWRALQAENVDVGHLLTGDRPLLVEYLVGDDELLVLTVARGEDGVDTAATVVPFKRRELADQIGKAMQPAILADVAEWRIQSAPISTAILAPIAARLADRDRCVVIPDDLLWKIPFEALISGEDSLGARMPVTYATSLATLALEQRIAASHKPHDGISAAIFAAPAIPQAVRAQLTLAQTGWKEPDEATALASATELARVYGDSASVRSKLDASEIAARTASETADVLHFTAPLQVIGATPLFSMVVLSGTGDQLESDGRWELREWFRASSHARVIVLADGSSFGAAGIGAAMDTIAWAAVALGVPAVVTGRWPSDAFSSQALLAAFHTALAKGTAPIDAWSASVAAARTKSAAPSAWAGARLIGAGGPE